jgi:hypothetical protein
MFMPKAFGWGLHDQLCSAVRAQAKALTSLLRLHVEGEPLHRPDTDARSALDSTLRASLPRLTPEADSPPGRAGFDHHCDQPEEGAGSDLGRLPLRPPKAVDDRDDLPSYRSREADTVPRMRKEEEKNKPDQQRKHGFFVPEDITSASASPEGRAGGPFRAVRK